MFTYLWIAKLLPLQSLVPAKLAAAAAADLDDSEAAGVAALSERRPAAAVIPSPILQQYLDQSLLDEQL